MQFFPNMTPAPKPPLQIGGKILSADRSGFFGGKTLSSGKSSALNSKLTSLTDKLSAMGDTGKAFLEALNEELASAGITPVADVSVVDRLPSGFRVLSHDRKATLDSEDIAFITGKLKKRGVKEDVLTGIEALLQTGATPTIGNIMASVTKHERVSAPLTDDERISLQSALAKLQLPAETMEEVEAFMDSGQGGEALRLINKNMETLSSGDITLERKEMLSLLRGLDLSEKTHAATRPLLGKDATASFSRTDLERILAPAAGQFAEDRANRETLAAELKGVMDEALHAKKMREASAPVADARGSRQSERAAIRMRDDLTAKPSELGRNVLEQARKADAQDQAGTFADRNDDQPGEQTSDQDTRRHVAASAVKDIPTAKSSGGETTAARDGFLSILNRIESPMVMDMPLQTTTAPASDAPQAAQQAFAHRTEIFAQVEQGMLRQVQNGSHQLTLHLNPEELGQISLVLTVKGDEVRAAIRAENPETAAVLSDQMDRLRASLEGQNLTVTELTVETQLPQDTTKGQEWTGMEQYNQEQELREQARFVHLARMRREGGTDLAQDMQSKGTQEEIAEQGLHIIA